MRRGGRGLRSCSARAHAGSHPHVEGGGEGIYSHIYESRLANWSAESGLRTRAGRVVFAVRGDASFSSPSHSMDHVTAALAVVNVVNAKEPPEGGSA
jgi:hypothetical protein